MADETCHLSTSNDSTSSIGTFELKQLDGLKSGRPAVTNSPLQPISQVAQGHTIVMIPQYAQYTTRPNISRISDSNLPSGHDRYISVIPNRCLEYLPGHERLLPEVDLDRYVIEHLAPFFVRSNLSQEALRQWDKQLGLSPSHARTTLESGRTRKMLLEYLSCS